MTGCELGHRIPPRRPTNSTAHLGHPPPAAGVTGTYLHLPRVVGDDEAQQDDGGEADKAFQGQGEHGVLQGESRAGVREDRGYGTSPALAAAPGSAPPGRCCIPTPTLSPLLPGTLATPAPNLAWHSSTGTTSTAGTAGKRGLFSKRFFFNPILPSVITNLPSPGHATPVPRPHASLSPILWHPNGWSN